jgi:WhiB family redox-sensing transcriptional regulator
MLERWSIDNDGGDRRGSRAAASEAVELLMQPDTRLGELDLLDVLLERPEWHARAACRGMGTERFFPADHVALLDARRVCAGCDVQRECGEFAMTVPSLKGIWAGMSERGRARARKAASYDAAASERPSEDGRLCPTVPLRRAGGAGSRR